MAEQEPTPEQLAAIAAENEQSEAVNYKPPAQKSLQEIQELDKDDESLRKYKEALLGNCSVAAGISYVMVTKYPHKDGDIQNPSPCGDIFLVPMQKIAYKSYQVMFFGKCGKCGVDPTSPNVQVTRLTLMCETAPAPLTLDLQGDLESYKKQSFVLKEGVEYRIKISFKVNKEIVSGLKYVQQTFRKGVKIDKSDYMVGSYGPRPNEYEFLTPLEEAPKGLLARGTYNIKSKFTDDDKHDHLSWEWNLNIKKDWKD
ncbi:Rho GDP-dissociation inhibitor 1 [Anabarilius grahami]|uniref:Rho GDP-dissociation inhibitor 1 n=1 Tax=Anabarilius grahami TaxID=495550 RepID=A0A3N0YU92_ANAGA|nr:Rho GDP-dissociation inhibitor 1 [Anabarilius grahami]